MVAKLNWAIGLNPDAAFCLSSRMIALKVSRKKEEQPLFLNILTGMFVGHTN
ncbi:MAG: hypothetical protein AVDCRST_MAG56-4553 [uncultured Cytophagales bacterium]|uniref:Uncharacterized protein n=1 Tax=uncultured Cytophagales bacterium TaxID=158755 RepID=A0A6J4JYB4_9SPHI|nr:MAG: hypothetical protein AVDCRST_MAG56-4553 [uncultured Cytophagales bacterium]